jgi:hypothetical protein
LYRHGISFRRNGLDCRPHILGADIPTGRRHVANHRFQITQRMFLLVHSVPQRHDVRELRMQVTTKDVLEQQQTDAQLGVAQRHFVDQIGEMRLQRLIDEGVLHQLQATEVKLLCHGRRQKVTQKDARSFGLRQHLFFSPSPQRRHLRRRHILDVRFAAVDGVYFARVKVDAGDAVAGLGKGHGQRQPDIAQCTSEPKTSTLTAPYCSRRNRAACCATHHPSWRR